SRNPLRTTLLCVRRSVPAPASAESCAAPGRVAETPHAVSETSATASTGTQVPFPHPASSEPGHAAGSTGAAAHADPLRPDAQQLMPSRGPPRQRVADGQFLPFSSTRLRSACRRPLRLCANNPPRELLCTQLSRMIVAAFWLFTARS